MPPDSPLIVLVVEDDALQRQLLARFLEQQGYCVWSAVGVAEAFVRGQQGLPDAMLVDAMLPDGSGLEVCRQMRLRPGGARLPILLMTAYDIEPVIDGAFAAGATDFIAKPINLKLLDHRLRYLIRAAQNAAELQAREMQYRMLIDVLPDMVIRVRSDGRILYFKPSERCPLEMAELALTPDMQLADIFPTEAVVPLLKALQKQDQQVFEYRAPCTGTWRDFEARIIPDGAGAFVALIRDVTERKATERLREDFTAMVAHDIRSPLTSVQIALDVLEQHDACANEDLQDLIALARQGLSKVTQLAGDLLELFRSNQAGMTLLKGVVFPIVLLRRCLDEITLQAQNKGITLNVELPEDLPPFVGDAPKLERAFSNLLSNAVKFTPEGGCISVCGATDGEWITVSIADTGCGIPPEFQAVMFEPYCQGGSRDDLGFGLGLAIVKRIVTAHRGRISVESVVGQGTTFTVRLPLQLS